MKRTLLFLFVIIFLKFFSQIPEIEGKEFRATFLVTDNPGIIDLSSPASYYGINYLIFMDNGTFETGVQPSFCGLDKLIQYRGKYRVEGQKLAFIITQQYNNKNGSFENLENPIDKGSYFFVKEKYFLRLLKDLQDQPKKNYFKLLKLNVPKTANPKRKEVMEQYAFLYNQSYQIWKNKNQEKKKWIAKMAEDWRRYAQSTLRLSENEENLSSQLQFYNKLADKVYDMSE